MKKIIIIGLLLLTSACNLGVPSPTAEVSLPATETETLLPLPQPVTETPTIVFTETAVPTLAPPPRFYTEEFDAASPYWEFLQAGGVTSPVTSFENGSLRVDFSSPDTWFVGAVTTHSYSNVFVRARTSFSPNGSAGVICRYSAENGWYEFNASNTGGYSVLLGQWLAPDVVKYIPVLTDGTNLLSGNSSNEIGLFCQDNFLQLYVNGTLVRRVEVTNYGLTEGGVGISASSFAEVPMIALFESFSVSDQ